MAYNSKSKLKTLYLKQILEEETDEEHGLTMRQIIERLEQYGVDAERKSIYRDIEVLREFGCDIQTYQRSPVEYAIVRHDFTMDELMLMVDAVESCKALTMRQSNKLVTNIKLLASDSQRALLDRRIHVPGRVRSKSDSVFSCVDAIHEALRLRRKIEFFYYRRDVNGKRYKTRDGRSHVVTPVEVVYADGFYYLTAWDDDHECMVEYRLDRMGPVTVTEEKATRNEEIAHYVYDEAKYESFGRFGGDEVLATFEVDADKVEIVMDRFGEDAEISRIDDSTAKARVHVRKSEQFFGWVAGMGNKVRITGPTSLVEDYRSYLQSLLDGTC